MIGKLERVDFNKKKGEVVIENEGSFTTLSIYFSEMPLALSVGAVIEFELKRSEKGIQYGRFIKLADSKFNPFDKIDNLSLYDWGEQVKTNFVEKVAPNLGLDLAFCEPSNKKSGKINFIDRTNNRQGDIQVQETPFYTSGRHFYGDKNYNPSYTVTLNKENYESYAKLGVDFDIYYLVKWKELSYDTQYETITVEEVQGIWVTSFYKIREVVESGKAHLHEYRYRRGEETYLLNLNDEDVFTRYL